MVLLETLWVNGLSAQNHPLLRGDKLVKNTTCRGFLTGKGCVLWGTKPIQEHTPRSMNRATHFHLHISPLKRGFCASLIYSAHINQCVAIF